MIGLFLCRQVHGDRLRGGILGVVRVVGMSRYTHTPAIFFAEIAVLRGEIGRQTA